MVRPSPPPSPPTTKITTTTTSITITSTISGPPSTSTTTTLKIDPTEATTTTTLNPTTPTTSTTSTKTPTIITLTSSSGATTTSATGFITNATTSNPTTGEILTDSSTISTTDTTTRTTTNINTKTTFTNGIPTTTTETTVTSKSGTLTSSTSSLVAPTNSSSETENSTFSSTPQALTNSIFTPTAPREITTTSNTTPANATGGAGFPTVPIAVTATAITLLAFGAIYFRNKFIQAKNGIQRYRNADQIEAAADHIEMYSNPMHGIGLNETTISPEEIAAAGIGYTPKNSFIALMMKAGKIPLTQHNLDICKAVYNHNIYLGGNSAFSEFERITPAAQVTQCLQGLKIFSNSAVFSHYLDTYNEDKQKQDRKLRVKTRRISILHSEEEAKAINLELRARADENAYLVPTPLSDMYEVPVSAYEVPTPLNRVDEVRSPNALFDTITERQLKEVENVKIAAQAEEVAATGLGTFYAITGLPNEANEEWDEASYSIVESRLGSIQAKGASNNNSNTASGQIVYQALTETEIEEAAARRSEDSAEVPVVPVYSVPIRRTKTLTPQQPFNPYESITDGEPASNPRPNHSDLPPPPLKPKGQQK